MGYHAVVGVRRDRRLSDGTRLDRAATYGEAVFLEGLKVPVYVAPYMLKRDGTKEERFVICAKALSPDHIVRWGKKRWSIEDFFKTAKGSFSLQRFGRGTKLGVYRYLLLSLLAYWGYLSQGRKGLPKWGEAAQTILEAVLPQTVIEGLLKEVGRQSALLRSHGLEVRVNGCQI